MDWSWATSGVTNETPRTMGPECENYMTNRRRWIEAVLFNILFVCVIKWARKRIEPIHIPEAKELDKPHSTTRLILLILMTLIFGIEMGFKLANRSVIFVLNPCHIQTLVQIYLLAAKPSKLTITLFRIQMNNLNGPFLAFIFPEVECRTLPFEQATYWIQHAMLYIIPVYILRSGAYQVEDIKDFNWAIIGVEVQLIYHFGVLNFFSILFTILDYFALQNGTIDKVGFPKQIESDFGKISFTSLSGINLNMMLCAAETDPFQGDNYRIAAVIHESILCPILNKVTVLIFAPPKSIQYNTRSNTKKSVDLLSHQQLTTLHQQPQQHKTIISETIKYYPDETTTTLLTHRPNTNPIEYPHSAEQDEAVYQGGGGYIPEQSDMEMIDVTKPRIITAEYTMPTTKID